MLEGRAKPSPQMYSDMETRGAAQYEEVCNPGPGTSGTRGAQQPLCRPSLVEGWLHSSCCSGDLGASPLAARPLVWPELAAFARAPKALPRCGVWGAGTQGWAGPELESAQLQFLDYPAVQLRMGTHCL